MFGGKDHRPKRSIDSSRTPVTLPPASSALPVMKAKGHGLNRALQVIPGEQLGITLTVHKIQQIINE